MLAALLALASWLPLSLPAVQDPGSGLLEPVELRALHVPLGDLDVLTDREHLAAAVDRLSEIGFDALVVVAREPGRILAVSDTLRNAKLVDTLFAPDRDVLREVVFESHRAGLEVLLAIDGTLSLDPASLSDAKLPLAPGEKNRPDPRDAGVRALVRGLALDMARTMELDGLVLWNGLPAFTVEEARGPEAKQAAEELAAWRNEVRAIDPYLVVGWAATDARFAPPADFRALDFVVLPEAPRDAKSPLALWLAEKPGRAALQRTISDATTPEGFAADLAAARAKPFQGEVLGPFAALVSRDGALTDVMTEGIEAPYYARATLPWRNGKAWRPRVEMTKLVNNSGNFSEVEVEGPIQHAVLPAGQAGVASWELKPPERGVHELWVWFPPGHENPPKLTFTIPTDARRGQRIELPGGPGRGWVRVGLAMFNQDKKADVLRLDVVAGGALPVAVGPLVALPRRRPERR